MENVHVNKDVLQAKELLRKKGYYVDALYHIDDVKDHYDCNNETAQEILCMAVNNDGTANQVWDAISHIAEDEFNLDPVE